MSYQNILVNKEGKIGTVQLNRPKVLNALSTDTVVELVNGLEELDNDHTINVIILMGSESVFAREPT